MSLKFTKRNSNDRQKDKTSHLARANCPLRGIWLAERTIDEIDEIGGNQKVII